MPHLLCSLALGLCRVAGKSPLFLSCKWRFLKRRKCFAVVTMALWQDLCGIVALPFLLGYVIQTSQQPVLFLIFSDSHCGDAGPKLSLEQPPVASGVG